MVPAKLTSFAKGEKKNYICINRLIYDNVTHLAVPSLLEWILDVLQLFLVVVLHAASRLRLSVHQRHWPLWEQTNFS
jgi:hypothetical protein